MDKDVRVQMEFTRLEMGKIVTEEIGEGDGDNDKVKKTGEEVS